MHFMKKENGNIMNPSRMTIIGGTTVPKSLISLVIGFNGLTLEGNGTCFY